MTPHKPVIGISCGDLNGVGLELVIKTFQDTRVFDHCTPVLYASGKAVNFYRKTIPDSNLNYQTVREYDRLNPKQLNIFTCWEEDVNITPGELTDVGGKYAVISLQSAVAALQQKQIAGLVTLPIHKKNVQSAEFPHTGHTPYLKQFFQAPEVVMMMCSDQLRVALLTEHVPVKEVAQHITKEKLLKKLQLVHKSLQTDFGIDKPRIAVLGLNPHSGDEGLIGNEEETIIKPAIKEAKNQNIIVVGPYPADGFFARGRYDAFDCILAMYHDQGLIPFKTLAGGEGVNYTAGLPAVRTSPDHGTAFDIAGKNRADNTSFLTALFTCIDIINQRAGYKEVRQNPLRKMSGQMMRHAKDESFDD
ncbi:MAG: 4-hydroxythreonine-4-phosphate dehydrogenase PdxA [Bacteroidetes bacterium]|nr:4-hydroxythreonine-4-phosphate dehydrogenase PdxA [Bacteroidota bacterium]